MKLIIKSYNALNRRIYKLIKIPIAIVHNIHFPFSNYLYKGTFHSENLIVDVGCADNPDLSIFMIEKFNLTAIAIDPTLKHKEALLNLERELSNFTFFPLAVSNQNGKIAFHESLENVSGSILSDHKNIIDDTTTEYEVDSVTLKELSKIIGKEVDLVKLDLEGAEYDILESAKREDLALFKQIFVEFHHHCTTYTKLDTLTVVNKLKDIGMKTFTMDKRNYLFYW